MLFGLLILHSRVTHLVSSSQANIWLSLTSMKQTHRMETNQNQTKSLVSKTSILERKCSVADLLYLLPLFTPEASSTSVSFLPHIHNGCQRCPRQRAVPFLFPTHLPPAEPSQCHWWPPGPHSPGTPALAAARCCLPRAQPPCSPSNAALRFAMLKVTQH